MKPINFKHLMPKFGKIILEQKAKWKWYQKVFWHLDWRNSRLINVQSRANAYKNDIYKIPRIKALVKKLSKLATNDGKAVSTLRWTHNNCKYLSDKLTSGVLEVWETPYEALTKWRCQKCGNVYYEGEDVPTDRYKCTNKKCRNYDKLIYLKNCMDCETGAEVSMNILYLLNLPSVQYEVRAGWVKMPNGSKGGHAYLIYTSDSNAVEYVLDWCYYYDSRPIKSRPTLYDIGKYLDIWFGFNFEGAYKKISNPNKRLIK